MQPQSDSEVRRKPFGAVDQIRICGVATPSSATRLLIAAAGAVLVRPRLWPVAIVTWFRMVPARWWSKAPFLPVPANSFLEFRLVTMYGGKGAADPSLHGADIVAWLDWCKKWKSETV